MESNKFSVDPIAGDNASVLESLALVKTGVAPRLFGIAIMVLFIVSIIIVMFVPWSTTEHLKSSPRSEAFSRVPLWYELWRQFNHVQPSALPAGCLRQ